MADGFDIHLDAPRAERLERAAKAAGVSPADYALLILDQAFQGDWEADFEALAEYDRTGEFVPAQEALATFKLNVESKVAARRK